MTNHEKRFHVLDSFRGLCALFVVVFHMRVYGSITELTFFRNANIFVEFFFVLSGFVLTHSYGSRNSFDFKKFFISRTFRLLPLHWVMLLIFIVLEFGKWIAYRNGLLFNNIPFTGNTSPYEIIPNILLLQSWTKLTEPLSFNAPAWSISIEYYIYFIFGFLMFFKKTFRYAIWLGLFSLTFFLLQNDSTIFPMPVMMGISCFFSGAISYLFYVWIEKNIILDRVLISILEFFVLLLVVLIAIFDFKYHSMLTILIFCLTVVLFAREAGFISGFLRANFFGFIGKLSYSIYLIHYAILFCILSLFVISSKIFKTDYAPMVDGVRYLNLGNNLKNNILVFLILGVIIWVSSFTYKRIEMKGQERGRKIIKSMLSSRTDKSTQEEKSAGSNLLR